MLQFFLKKLPENQKTTDFIYLTSSNFATISHINYWDQVIPGKNYGKSGMVHFPETNHSPSPYSMLQHIGRVAAPKLVLRNCLRYLQTTLIMGGVGLVSGFMWGIVAYVFIKFRVHLSLLNCSSINISCFLFIKISQNLLWRRTWLAHLFLLTSLSYWLQFQAFFMIINVFIFLQVLTGHPHTTS